MVLELAIDVLGRLLHGNVHVAIQAGERAKVVNARVEPHSDAFPRDACVGQYAALGGVAPLWVRGSTYP